jgi:catechol 2,3-dioxygenase-like lactoylglutathione lyase family enzyme
LFACRIHGRRRAKGLAAPEISDKLLPMIARDNGFQEAVGIVADAGETACRLCDALGYREKYRGEAPAAALALWQPGATATAHEVLIGHPDSGRGDIRLIAFDGAPGGRMRDGAQAWDPGGIFDINIRALAGIEPLHRALGLGGFLSPAPITDWDFGALSVREVVENNADGLAIALMERVSPPLTAYEGVNGPASWVFNSTQVVPDFAAARAFYVDALGWQVVQESDLVHEDGRNCMGLPLGLAPAIKAKVGIYQANARMEGSVEIIAFDCGGIDFSAGAPPDRGWAALRFAVSDAAAFLARAEVGGCEVSSLAEFDWAPHGKVRAGSVRTPWGARLEFLQPL